MSLRLSGVSVSFGRRLILDGVDLETASGEFVGLTGPSGAGKSTLLNVVAGLQRPSAGSVSADPNRAYVFQKPTLLPWRDTLGNVAFGLECRGEDGGEARARAREMLAEVGLADFARHWPHQLSEGMKQRVSLARAMIVKPRLVLLDEPFSSLDAKARRSLQDLLLGFWRRERFTALFVSHWAEELSYLAQRVVVFSEKPARVERIVPAAELIL